MRDTKTSHLGIDIGAIFTIFGLIDETAREMLSPKFDSVSSDPPKSYLTTSAHSSISIVLRGRGLGLRSRLPSAEAIASINVDRGRDTLVAA